MSCSTYLDLALLIITETRYMYIMDCTCLGTLGRFSIYNFTMCESNALINRYSIKFRIKFPLWLSECRFSQPDYDCPGLKAV